MKNAFSMTGLVAVMALIVLLGACALISGRETAGQYVDDATITATIKAKILEDPDLKVLQINVETMQGVVQLSGFVDSPQSEAKAIKIARQVRGVKLVKADLIVRNVK